MTASRARRHGLIGCAAVAAFALLYAILNDGRVEFGISLSTGYVALALLAVTFALGPIYYLTTRRAPASTYLRRDVAIWGGLFSIAHVVFGLQVHLKGKMWAYFLFEDCGGCRIPIRYDAFGIANYTGAAAALIVLVLLAISNDLSIRKLGLERWSAIQHWGRACAVLTVIHSLIYEVLEKRTVPALIGVWSTVAVVAVLFAWRWFERRRATGP
jgi:sulfoxide reductase heme-binding subunit YedZ